MKGGFIMNCIFLRKTFSIAAAFLLCSTLTRMPVSAAPEPEAQAEAVPMIVLLDAKPEDAAEEKAEQERVFAEICARYPQAEMRCRFTELLNGFSCTFPESCADAVRAIPGVASAERCGTAKLTPMLADAARLGGIPQFYEETDCTGEGKVICIIDTELDVTHPMFAPLADGVAAKLTKEDIAEIADTVGFSREIDPDLAYVNSKVPFAIDYLDNDRYALANTREKAYHGTHVAGIAAGNEYTDPDGKTISGIAKNAQIVFMAIDNFLTPDEDYYQEHYLDAEFSEQYLYDTIIAALDDAAKLHADAVNMSFGSTGPEMNADDALIRAIKAAEEAGMTVCISAGNDGSQSMGMLPAENPSHSTLNSFICENGGALAIASAENDASREAGVLLFQGEPIIYNAYYTSTFAPEPTYLGDVLPAGEYEYVDCGRGFEEDFAGKDLTGKIALIRRDTQFFSNMAILSEKAHAVGVIVCNKVDDIRNYMAGTEQIPMALISLSDGERLFSAAEKKITVTPDRQSILLPTAVSDFTSWGTNSSLELRPDIMGVGGAVESAAYGGETAMLSGTSMSSPYLAGCAVLLSEYLDRNGCTLTGEARQRYMRNLLMTGAVIRRVAVSRRAEGQHLPPALPGRGEEINEFPRLLPQRPDPIGRG